MEKFINNAPFALVLACVSITNSYEISFLPHKQAHM